MSLIEITAIFKREFVRRNDWIAGSAELVEENKQTGKEISISGIAEVDDMLERQTYRLYGKWVDYRGSKQFQFKTFVHAEPHSRSGIVAYLHQAGVGNGIGWKRADAIWEKFRGDGVRVLRETPEVIAAAIRGLSNEEATRASKWLKDRQRLEGCTIAVNSLLNGKGFPKIVPRLAIKAWGNEAVDRIKKDPFQLMRFKGCGFKRCDNLHLQLGLSRGKLRRQTYCAAHSVSSASDGHTWYPAQYVANQVSRSIGSEARPTTAIKMAIRIGNSNPHHYAALAKIREDEGMVVEGGKTVHLADATKALAESTIARLVSRRIDGYQCEGFWPDAFSIDDIDDHQRSELDKALSGPIGILGGSPGTGKTYSAARVISAIADRIGIDNIAAAAPTGKAAVRLTESMADYDLPLQCRTWHSLLGMSSGDEFDHNESNPWNYKLIVGDESSMIDTNLMAAIIRAIPVGCHLLLIGDINQLPPVGHGAPLRDLIAAGLPCGELTEIKRNSGGIVEACAAIRDKQPMPEDPGNLIWRQVGESQQLGCTIDTLHAAAEAGFDAVWDCQILVAVNDKSQLSRKAVNVELQAELNQNPAIKGTPFRLDDKVVNLQNSRFPLIEDANGEVDGDEKAYVANGELGKVTEVAEKYLVVKLDSPYRVVKVPRGNSKDGSTGCSWDLGYALSCHKSQGSEWPVVVVMLDSYPGARRVCSREWLYTAISRAKDKCFLVGKRSVADDMCTRTAIDKRKTFLRELICLNRAKLEMAGL